MRQTSTHFTFFFFFSGVAQWMAVSTATGWITIEFSSNIHGPHGMKTADFHKQSVKVAIFQKRVKSLSIPG